MRGGGKGRSRGPGGGRRLVDGVRNGRERSGDGKGTVVGRRNRVNAICWHGVGPQL